MSATINLIVYRLRLLNQELINHKDFSVNFIYV